MKLLATLRRLLRGERGQDLIEYTLLLGFVALSGVALFLASGKTVGQIWQTTDTTVSAAALAAGAATPPATDTPATPGDGSGDGGGHHDEGDDHHWR